MTRKVQTFPGFGGSGELTLPAQVAPWKILSIYCEVQVDAAETGLIGLRAVHGKVCPMWWVTMNTVATGGYLYRATFAPLLVHTSAASNPAIGFQTAPLPDQWLDPSDEVVLRVEDVTDATSIDAIAITYLLQGE